MQRKIDSIGRQRLEICSKVMRGEAIERPAITCDQAVEVVSRD
jgi:hypothetical protein